jgi:hypothetical protein
MGMETLSTIHLAYLIVQALVEVVAVLVMCLADLGFV